MILNRSNTRKQVVLPGNVSEIGYVFMLTSRMMEAKFLVLSIGADRKSVNR